MRGLFFHFQSLSSYEAICFCYIKKYRNKLKVIVKMNKYNIDILIVIIMCIVFAIASVLFLLKMVII